MGKTSLELVCNGSAVLQQTTRPADTGIIRGVSIVLVAGTAEYGSLFARLSVASRSGASLNFVANLASGYISASSSIGWVGEYPLGPTDELVLDLWGTATNAVVRGNVVTKRRD
jgi:hypothetical protein